MNELTLGLIGAGVCIVAAIFIYNLIQTMKIRRRLPKTVEEKRVEVDDEAPSIDSQAPRYEPTFSQAGEITEEPTLFALDESVKKAPTLNLSIVDSRIDCLVPITLHAPVLGERIFALTNRFRHAGSKSVIVDGRIEGNQDWLLIEPDLRYEQLRVSVQLANRAGALNEVEFSEFVAGVQQFADALDGDPDFPDMRETVSMARELDRFSASCDVQLQLFILSEETPWSANYIQSLATQDQLVLSRDGQRFVYLDEQHHPIFSLQFANTNFLKDDLAYKTGHVLTLNLDVPMVAEAHSPFRQMCEYARSLSARLEAKIVDEQNRYLSDEALDAIESQLFKVYATLQAASIPAGSPLTRRLFD